MRAAARERLAKQESEESRSKETLVKNAATYLEQFYQVTPQQALCPEAAHTLHVTLCNKAPLWPE